MIDSDKNIPQGELFNEICYEKAHLSDMGGSGQGSKKQLWLHFDKFLLLVLVVIMCSAVSFALGYEKGRRARSKGVVSDQTAQSTSLLDSEESLIVIKSETAGKELVPIPVKNLPSSESALPTEEKAVPKDTASVAPASREGWTIQVVTYTSDMHAQREVKKLEQEGFQPFLIPSGKYIQVCVDTFPTKNDAVKVLKVFKKEKGYFDAFVRKINR